MPLRTCEVCELGFDPEKQSAKCPHQSGVVSGRPWQARWASKPFPALYRGMCHGCWDEIEIGDDIVMWKGHAHHNDTLCCDGIVTDEEPRGIEQPRDRWA